LSKIRAGTHFHLYRREEDLGLPQEGRLSDDRELSAGGGGGGDGGDGGDGGKGAEQRSSGGFPEGALVSNNTADYYIGCCGPGACRWRNDKGGEFRRQRETGDSVAKAGGDLGFI
jgi:hypothetical protein